MLLVLWCDNRRYGGGSGCRPSHAGVTWAQIELSAEAKFYDALAGWVPSSPSVVAAGLSDGLAEVCLPCTEHVERPNERSCIAETLRQWQAEMIGGGFSESRCIIWRWTIWESKACISNSHREVCDAIWTVWMNLLVEIFMWFKCLSMNIFPAVYLNSRLSVQGE